MARRICMCGILHRTAVPSKFLRFQQFSSASINGARNEYRYLIEYRNYLQHFRDDELLNLLKSYGSLNGISYKVETVKSSGVATSSNVVSQEAEVRVPEDIPVVLTLSVAIPDISDGFFVDSASVVPYCSMLSSNIDLSVPLSALVSKSSLIRTVVQVWEECRLLEEWLSCTTTINKMSERLCSVFRHRDDTWKLTISRYGKAVETAAHSKERQQFDILTDRIPTHNRVKLTNPTHEFYLLEDYHTSPGFHDTHPGVTGGICAHRYYFGYVVGRGETVDTKYCIKKRPYIGTTTLPAVNAHVTANAAGVRPGCQVLDPFCGTGSLVIACAALGADSIVGADCDADALGYGSRHTGDVDMAAAGRIRRSKNSKFVRKTAVGEQIYDQLNSSIQDNVEYYSFGSQVRDLLPLNAIEWTRHRQGASDIVEGFGKFDAVVADPPFGIREKFHIPIRPVETNEGCEPSIISNGNEILGLAHGSIGLLLATASCQLRPNGKLAFWFFDKDCSTAVEVTEVLDKLEGRLHKYGGWVGTLRRVKVLEEQLSGTRRRYLCVYTMKE